MLEIPENSWVSWDLALNPAITPVYLQSSDIWLNSKLNSGNIWANDCHLEVQTSHVFAFFFPIVLVFVFQLFQLCLCLYMFQFLQLCTCTMYMHKSEFLFVFLSPIALVFVHVSIFSVEHLITEGRGRGNNSHACSSLKRQIVIWDFSHLQHKTCV